jgi:hypothetical protein
MERKPWLPVLGVGLLIAASFAVFQRLGSDARVRETLERNLGYLSVAEVDHFQRTHRYTADIGALRARDAAPLTPDPGNTVTIVRADSVGFVAIGSSTQLTGHYRTCGIYLGSVTPPYPALKRPGAVACW